VNFFKKYPSFVYIFMRENNQIHDKILVRSRIGHKFFEQLFIYRSYSMGEASLMKQNRTPKLCMKLRILFLVSYLLYDLWEITLLANGNKEHKSGVKIIIFYSHSPTSYDFFIFYFLNTIYRYVHFIWPTSITNS
jgi:hypothetical protein